MAVPALCRSPDVMAFVGLTSVTDVDAWRQDDYDPLILQGLHDSAGAESLRASPTEAIV